MMNTRTKLETLLATAQQYHIDNVPVKAQTSADLDYATRQLIIGMESLLAAVHASNALWKRQRELQMEAHFYDASKVLAEAHKADKILADLVKFWSAEMANPAQEMKGTLPLF